MRPPDGDISSQHSSARTMERKNVEINGSGNDGNFIDLGESANTVLKVLLYLRQPDRVSAFESLLTKPRTAKNKNWS